MKSKATNTNGKGTTYHIGTADVRRLVEEAQRKKVKPGKVLRYWLRLGMQAEPQINAILT